MPRLNNSEILESIRKQIGSDKLFHGNSFKKVIVAQTYQVYQKMTVLL